MSKAKNNLILSVSRRTDVPAFYADWFYARLAAGEVLAVNPYNPNQRRTISLCPQEVGGFVFWTKNPAPMLPGLSALRGYPYYFQCTLTGYGGVAEPAFPRGKAVDAVRRLADIAGPERVCWRYDPMLFGEGFSPAYHAENFARLAAELGGAANRCTVSFYDSYAHTKRPMAELGLRGPSKEEKNQTAALLAAEAKRAGVLLYSCAEELAQHGVTPGACIDAGLLSRLAGRPLAAARDKNQRPGCCCAASVDIGMYNTCPGGCVYCYACRSPRLAAAEHRKITPQCKGLSSHF